MVYSKMFENTCHSCANKKTKRAHINIRKGEFQQKNITSNRDVIKMIKMHFRKNIKQIKPKLNKKNSIQLTKLIKIKSYKRTKKVQ